MAVIPSWFWIAFGWALVALALWVGVRGRLLRIRLKQPHCPKCGYSTTGLMSLTCPECGHTVKSEREFSYRRRLKRWRTAAGVLLALGWLCTQMPSMIAYGWPAIIPDGALVYVSPTHLVDNGSSGWRWPAPASTPPWQDRLRDKLFEETWRRAATGTLGKHSGSIFLQRCVTDPRSSLSIHRRVPSRWPWDVALEYKSSLYENFQFDWHAVPPTGPTQSARIIGTAARTYTFGEIDVQIDARDDRLHFHDAVGDEATSAAVVRALRPRLQLDSGLVFIHFDDRTDDPVWKDVPMYTDFFVRVLYKGELVGDGWCYAAASPGPQKTIGPVMHWNDLAEFTITRDPDIELIITGNPGGSTDRSLEQGRTQRAKTWSGSARFHVPLEPPPRKPQ